jgi:hypothetical protein
MIYRIYIDESGTHDERFLIIGMLFVPDHGTLHAELCRMKDATSYLNTSPKRAQRYKEVHFTRFRSPPDIEIGKRWVDSFIKNTCFFRSVVIDWSIFDGKFFGDPFEPAALKKRRAYKKWAEMLLQPELSTPGIVEVRNAELYLDRLKIMYGYDVVDHLKDRFSGEYEGSNPYISKFQHTDSSKDANQCLQLCDLLTGCLYQELCPSTKKAKLEVRDYLKTALTAFGVRDFRPEFWKGFAPNTLRKHFPKYSAWFWKPTEEGRKRRSQKARRGKKR